MPTCFVCGTIYFVTKSTHSEATVAEQSATRIIANISDIEGDPEWSQVRGFLRSQGLLGIRKVVKVGSVVSAERGLGWECSDVMSVHMAGGKLAKRSGTAKLIFVNRSKGALTT